MRAAALACSAASSKERARGSIPVRVAPNQDRRSSAVPQRQRPSCPGAKLGGVSMLDADWKLPSPRLRTARHVQALAPAVALAIGLGVILAFGSYTAAALAAVAALLAGVVVD